MEGFDPTEDEPIEEPAKKSRSKKTKGSTLSMPGPPKDLFKMIQNVEKAGKVERTAAKQADDDKLEEKNDLIEQIENYYSSEIFGKYLNDSCPKPKNIKKLSLIELNAFLKRLDDKISRRNNGNTPMMISQGVGYAYEKAMTNTGVLKIEGINTVVHSMPKYAEIMEHLSLKSRAKAPSPYVQLAMIWGMTSYQFHNMPDEQRALLKDGLAKRAAGPPAGPKVIPQDNNTLEEN